MRYRPPRNKWGADFAEDYERNLEDIERDITGVEEIVEGSKTNAEQALTFATEAKGKAESVQAQFNQVVIEGDSSVEAAQARVDAKNVAQPTLKARLDNDYNEVTAQLAQSVQLVNVKSYGAKGDGIKDDTTSIQNAINDAKGEKIVYFPKGIYMISQSLVSVEGKKLIIKGENFNGTEIKALSALTGYMVNPNSGYFITDITIRGNDKDGTYCIGSTTSNAGNVYMDNLRLYGAEYGLKFDGTSEFPVLANHKNIWCYNMRTCGMKFATDGFPRSGQSAFTIDNVGINNNYMRGISASNVSVTEGSTSDTITWDSTNAKEFGWVIMRRPSGSNELDDFAQVANVDSAATSYVASKTSGETWEYKVLRHTVGMYLKEFKAVHIGVLQSEYYGTGLYMRSCRASNINSFYYEWRGSIDGTDTGNPVCRGNGILLHACTAVKVGSAWAEHGLSAVEVFGSSNIELSNIDARGCSRSAIHLNQTNDTGRVVIDTVNAANGTPVVVSKTTSSFSKIYDALNPDMTSSTGSQYMERSISHLTDAKYSARYRDVVKSKLGADVDGGYVETNRFEAINNSKTKVSRGFTVDSSISTSLVHNVATDLLTFNIANNEHSSIILHYVGKVNDGSSVTRQVVSGMLVITTRRSSTGAPVMTITDTMQTKQIAGGSSINLTFSSASDANGLVTIRALQDSSYSNPMTINLVPISIVGATAFTQK